MWYVQISCVCRHNGLLYYSIASIGFDGRLLMLIECPACKKSVSKKSSKCINCGEPLSFFEKPLAKWVYKGLVIVATVAGFTLPGS